jgi:hypothetical protein
VPRYLFGWELWKPFVTEDLGVLTVQARDADSDVDGGVWASDAAANDGLSGALEYSAHGLPYS